MLKAVIFDFDGVITDSEMLHLAAFNRTLARFGLQITRQQYMDRYLGLTDAECVAALIEDGLLGLPKARIKQIVQQKKKVYALMALTQTRPIDGVEGFLAMLDASSIHMAICSGALRDEITGFLERTGLSRYFLVIVSAEDVRKGKPDPEGFLLTIDRLAQKIGPVAPKDCLVIEDAHWGISAAKAAGIPTIAVTNTYPPSSLQSADLIVDRLDKLTIQQLRSIAGN